MLRKALSAFVLILPCSANADESPAVHSFQIKLEEKAAATPGDSTTAFDGESIYGFTWHGTDREKTLKCDFIYLKASGDGKTFEERVDRNGGETIVDGKKEPFAPVDDEAIRKKLDLPICTIRNDEHGAEIGRQLNDDKEVAKFHRLGLADLATLFFAPFYPDRKQWTSAKDVPFGNGRKARGQLTYEVTSVAGNLVTVKVTGKLDADEFKDPLGRTVQVVQFSLAGEQVYDTQLKRWTGGTLSNDTGFEVPDEVKGRISMSAKKKLHLQPQPTPATK